MFAQLRWLVIFCGLALPALVVATPSTLIWIPSADIQPDGTWHLGVDNYFAHASDTRAPTDIGITFGLLEGRLEVGLDYFGGQDYPWSANAKYLVVPESPRLPAVAVGLYNFGTEEGVTDANMVYVLGARTFPRFRLTLGYCHGREATLDRDNDMLLAGLDGYLTADRKWWGAVDFQSGENSYGALSFGVAYSFSENASLLLGYNLYNDSNLDDTITTQLDINF